MNKQILARCTPGPWTFTVVNCAACDGDPALVGYVRATLATESNPVEVAVLYATRGNDEAERDANGRLIAAAPDLLDALRHAFQYAEFAVKFFKYQRVGHEFWPNREEAEANVAAMRAAIAKVEGRA